MDVLADGVTADVVGERVGVAITEDGDGDGRELVTIGVGRLTATGFREVGADGVLVGEPVRGTGFPNECATVTRTDTVVVLV
ncbi:MAG TPA: hypothetical protein VIQ80_02040 [Candidatus Saccharimonadales bacterium]